MTSTDAGADAARIFLDPIRKLHEQIREAVTAAAEQDSAGAVADVAHEEEGDTIYAINIISEEQIVAFFEREIAPSAPLVLIAEGLPGGKVVLPRGASEVDALWRIIVDPIDGTRGIMYQKRSAWVLTGVAPNRGPETDLQDIALAVRRGMPWSTTPRRTRALNGASGFTR